MPITPAVIADDCVGKRTGEICTALCIDSFEGDPVTYVCFPDGALHEEKTRKVGVIPVCSRRGNRQTDVSATRRQSRNHLDAWCRVSFVVMLAVLVYRFSGSWSPS